MSEMTVYLWIFLVAALVSLPCAWLGSILMLRSMALIGDAVSHSVLPGLVLAFLLTGHGTPLGLWAAAVVTGVVATLLIESISETTTIQAEAALGVVLTAMFSLGVLLVNVYAGQVDLDQECILFGEIAYAPLQALVFGVPSPVAFTGIVAFLVAVGLGLGYRTLLVTTFDRNLAEIQGFPVKRVQYALMAAVSITVVTAFESVGAVLVVAMLILPPATAFLLARSLSSMMLLASVQALLSCFLGVVVALQVDCSISAAIVLASGALFMLVWAGVRLVRRPRKNAEPG